MESNKLKLNPDKIDLLGSDTFPPDTVCNLGVVFDRDFNFRQHISQVCKSCFYHICVLRRIRRHISIATAKTISMALDSSRLDYCNSLLNNIAKRDLTKLQRVQNCLARVVLRAPRFSSSLSLLKQLHWLPDFFDSVLTCGFPQGSVLGPTLYCMYTKPIGYIVAKHGMQYHYYADDIQIYLTVE